MEGIRLKGCRLLPGELQYIRFGQRSISLYDRSEKCGRQERIYKCEKYDIDEVTSRDQSLHSLDI